MRILVLNSGSSSLKYRVLDVSSDAGNAHTLIGGSVTGIGGRSRLDFKGAGSVDIREERPIEHHEQAVEWVFSHLKRHEIEAVGHRVVHGGERFSQPIRLTDAVIADIDQLSDLAPLHNPPCLAAICAARTHLPGDVPMVAVFDTAFHAAMPKTASTYAIPHDLALKHHIRRYGFHGIAHRSMVEGYAAFTGTALSNSRVITVHLGNGCSAAAIRGGQSVDTSMGLTPLEGLVMGTRSGDLDPSVVTYLARQEQVDAETVEHWLNERSGLLGVSGVSNDMQEILKAERDGNPRAALAIDLFCHRVRKYIGAYLAVLGGADAVIFGGGIGEHAPSIRKRIGTGMDWCGLTLDGERNERIVDLPPGRGARISRDGARLPAFVVAVDEETAIAHETVRCLTASSQG